MVKISIEIVGDVLYGDAEAVSEVIGWVDAPSISTPMVRDKLDT